MNVVHRKSKLLLKKVPRYLNRYFNDTLQNAVFINSFPKSGTHLLYQVFENFPELKKYETFIATTPSISKKMRTQKNTINLLNKIVNGELVRGHLFFDPQYLKVIEAKKITIYFIYRDPRDVVISEAHYLTNMNKWHRLHKYFKSLNSLEEQIDFSIFGNDFLKTNILYDNISTRFNFYKGWIDSNYVYSLKYEDLISSLQQEVINDLIEFYLSNPNYHTNENSNNLLSVSLDSINPKKSHTFREGGSQKWKKYFTESNIYNFKKVAGNLLIELGYEKDLNW